MFEVAEEVGFLQRAAALRLPQQPDRDALADEAAAGAHVLDEEHLAW